MKKLCFSIFLSFSTALLFGETLIVSSVADDNSAGTLRYVLANAKDGDVVVFDDSLKGETIKIVKRGHADTAICINASVSIIGPEDKSITLDGGYSNHQDTGSRIFALTNSVATLICKNLVFTNAQGRDWGSQVNYGGAISALGDVSLDNCFFISNRSETVTIPARQSNEAGGAAVRAKGNLTVNNCYFEGNSTAGNNYGAVINAHGKNVSIKNCIFKNNSSGSYCAGVHFYSTVENASIEDCFFLKNLAGGTSCNGAAIFSRMSGGSIFIRDCIFRENGFSAPGGNACVFFSDGVESLYVKDCEFTGNRSSSTSGAIRKNKGVSVFVNCTVANNTSSGHGAGLDLRGNSYLVNCTVVGNGLFNYGDKSASGGIYRGGSSLNLLNTVVLYNYYVSDADGNAVSGNIYNQLNASTLANMASFADSSLEVDKQNFFASYGTMNVIYTHSGSNPDAVTFAEPVPVPLLNDDEKRSRVVEIAKQGNLDGKGLLVKLTDDLSYIGYSSDKGQTWTTFYGEDDGSAKLLLQDQRGVAFSEKRIPIGAAAIEFPMATQILVY